MTRAELTRSGLSRHGIDRAIASGELHRLGRGTYLIGPHAAGPGEWPQLVAARSALHPHAVLWGQAAAAWRELDGFDPPVPVQWRVPRNASNSHAYLVRRDMRLPPSDLGGLAVAHPAETLLHLGAGLAPRPGCAAARTSLPAALLVELAVEDALRRELTTVAELADLVASTTNRTPGRAVLAAVLAGRPVGAPPTESYLETRCHQVLRAAGIADFDRQVHLHDREGLIGRVDFARAAVVIEVTSRAWHDPKVIEDARRNSRIASAGYRLLQPTFADIEGDPAAFVEQVGRALALDAA